MFPNLSNLSNYETVHATPCIVATIGDDADDITKSKDDNKKEDMGGEWQTGLFGLFSTHDGGFNCFVQHCCCQPCVVASAMGNADLPHGVLVAIGFILGGGVVSAVAGYYARRQVAKKYNIKEGEFISILAAYCCLPCSNIQLVSTVAKEEDLKYGCLSVGKPTVTTVTVVKTEVIERV